MLCRNCGTSEAAEASDYCDPCYDYWLGKDKPMIDLKDLVKQGHQLARIQLITNNEKELVPMFHLVAPEGGTDKIIACPWSNTMEKEILVAEIKKTSHEMGAVAAMFISEVWFVVKEPGFDMTKLGDPPSQQPNRKEAVLAIAIDNDGNIENGQWDIVRNRPGGTITALVKKDDMKGTFDSWILKDLLPTKWS